ncbi:MAG TPA: ATP-binding protein [Methylomirabilota bacterium]|nr:ATP-binding protein [Methylomirabilota bacterium]
MKTVRRQRSPRATPARARTGGLTRELAKLRARLAEAEETLRAIRRGEVDAVVVAGRQGPQVFTLEGAEHAYRVLIESMNEGALTLTADKMILFANQCFARMVKCPLEQVIGGSMRRFLSADFRSDLRALLKKPGKSGSKAQCLLFAADGSKMPVQISLRPLGGNGSNRAITGLVVTDMTEARRNEEMLRAVSRRQMRAQEAERGHVALELHDHITQLLCAVLVRSQALAERLSTRDGPSKREAINLREMIGRTAGEVERISRSLRPGVLNELGLVAVLRDSSRNFADRTGVSLKLTCDRLTGRLPADTELTLYRIFQEALRNVETHSRARRIAVQLTRRGKIVELAVHDDGIGFDADRLLANRKGKGGLGLLSIRERAAYVGGVLHVKSAPGKGTTIRAQIPLNHGASPGGGVMFEFSNPNSDPYETKRIETNHCPAG